MSLAGSRGGLRPFSSVPCGVWGNAPTVFRAFNFKEAANKGAGSEASLPVTSRFLRSASKLLFPTSVLCRAKWARPTCLSFRHSNSFPQAEDFASAEATKGQWKRTKSAIALWKPSFGVICGLTFSLHGESRLRAQESAVIINRKEVILCSAILPSSSSF